MSTVMTPGQTCTLHLEVPEGGSSIPIWAVAVEWRSLDMEVASLDVAVDGLSAVATALRKGSTTVTAEVLIEGVSTMKLRETIRVDQPDLLELVVDDPV